MWFKKKKVEEKQLEQPDLSNKYIVNTPYHTYMMDKDVLDSYYELNTIEVKNLMEEIEKKNVGESLIIFGGDNNIYLNPALKIKYTSETLNKYYDEKRAEVRNRVKIK